jgi:predicted KAP-like P-loop ATPase
MSGVLNSLAMFIYDKPIETEKDDFLGRKRFSQHLGKALLDWKEKESLVIAIYGEWGSGKSSVINLANEYIKTIENDNKPTTIEFNPWSFSEEKNLSTHFFNEIAKELEIKHSSSKDKKIAENLKLYANLLSLAPKKETLNNLSSKILLGLGLIGISSSQIIQWIEIPTDWIKYIAFGIGLVLFLAGLFKDFLLGLSDFFQQKYLINKKSIIELKSKIKKALSERNKKIVIVIDDIDRLNQSEIKQIFRLIRVNADFPNTIYLLAFDRRIVEKNLEEQVGVSGKDYLNKIVQVNFDVPFAKPSKITAFLFKELDRILSVLPESAQKYFGQDDPYWANIYHSGFKDFFRNIRDVKRFASSLEFNISQMYQGDIMEVNPIDFIAIEAIRVFAPDFYLFMRDKSELFTSTDRNDRSSRDNNPRKEEIEETLSKLPNGTKESILELLKRLFPQIDGIFQYGYSTHGNEWQSSWSNNLRVCATNNFDSYFTLIPGGDEEELSQFEIEEILNKTNSLEDLEKIIREYIEKNKIRKVLQRIQDFTNDQNRISQDDVKNVVKALFNISDDLREEKVGMWDFGADMDLMRIIFQLLKREADKQKNFEILKEAILQSKGLFGPVQKVSLESSRKEKGKDPDEFVVPEDKIEELQNLCLEKIEGTSHEDLLKHKNLLYILYRWKEWSEEDKWKEFIEAIKDNDQKMLAFISKFISESRSQAIGDYGLKVTKRFNYKGLSDFLDLEELKTRMEAIKQENSEQYESNKETIDLFLNNFDKKDKGDLD